MIIVVMVRVLVHTVALVLRIVTVLIPVVYHAVAVVVLMRHLRKDMDL